MKERIKTVQITIDEKLADEVDRAVRKLRTTRSAFTRDALRAALAAERTRALEERHRRGYQESPVGSEELGVWEDEQVWPD